MNIINTLSTILNFKLFILGTMTITPKNIAIGVVILFAFTFFSRILEKGIFKILQNSKLNEGTSYVLSRVAHYALWVIGIVIGFQTAGINMSSLTVLFGFFSVGLGFGMQNIASNFVSGLILLFERPINVGDRVMINNHEGDVVEINIRSTTIRTVNNIHLIVPNSDFVSSPITNWTSSDRKMRAQIPVSVSYNSNIDTVLETLNQVIHENHDILKYPEPEVIFLKFGDSSWDLMMHVWISNPKDHLTIKSRINMSILRKFKERNIEIPFPQRDIHIRTSQSQNNFGGQHQQTHYTPVAKLIRKEGQVVKIISQ